MACTIGSFALAIRGAGPSSIRPVTISASTLARASVARAPLNSGDPAAVAVRMGELQARLDATYLPAAQNLAEGRVTTADRSSLDSFCSSVRQAGWPLRAQLRDSRTQ